MHADECVCVCVVCWLLMLPMCWCRPQAPGQVRPPLSGKPATVCLHSLRYLVHWFPLPIGSYIYQNWSGMRCEWKEFLHLIALPLKGEKHWLSKFKSTQAARARRTLANCCRFCSVCFTSVRFSSVRSMESMSIRSQSPRRETHTDWMSEGISYARQSKVLEGGGNWVAKCCLRWQNLRCQKFRAKLKLSFPPVRCPFCCKRFLAVAAFGIFHKSRSHLSSPLPLPAPHPSQNSGNYFRGIQRISSRSAANTLSVNR